MDAWIRRAEQFLRKYPELSQGQHASAVVQQSIRADSIELAEEIRSIVEDNVDLGLLEQIFKVALSVGDRAAQYLASRQ